MAPDALLVLVGDVLVVVEARGVLYVSLRLGDLYRLIRLVNPHDVHGDQGGLHAQEAHLHPDVLLAIGLVYKEIVDLTDLLSPVVVDLVALVLLLELSQPILARHDGLPHARLHDPLRASPEGDRLSIRHDDTRRTADTAC